jgi:hypothetical protein
MNKIKALNYLIYKARMLRSGQTVNYLDYEVFEHLDRKKVDYIIKQTRTEITTTLDKLQEYVMENYI